jgi:hypothetical protein
MWSLRAAPSTASERAQTGCPGLLVALGRVAGAPELWRWVAGLLRSPGNAAM